MKRIIVMMMAVIMMGGCATPPGEYKADDFVWKEITVNSNYEKVYSGYVEAGRKCNGMWDLGLKGYIFNESKRGYLDVFMPSSIFVGMGSTYVEGKVDFRMENEKTTKVNIGLLKGYTNPQDSTGHRRHLELYANNVIRCLEE